MKLNFREIRYFLIGIFVLVVGIFLVNKGNVLLEKDNEVENKLLYMQGVPNTSESKKEETETKETTEEENTVEPINENTNNVSNEESIEVSSVESNSNPTNTQEIVYDGLTMEELSAKLNRSMNSTIAGYGEVYARYSLELGLDPYLALAITLHETGCKWNCSNLVKACNNVGGMKGQPGCGGGSYKAFDSLEEGIKGYLNNLYNNYYAQGLTTPETIGPKYAGSSEWASKIYYYIDSIKAN